MSARRMWSLAAATLLISALVILSLIFGGLGDGSFDCPGNALELSRHPLPEDNPPPDGFYAAPVCNRAARDRMQTLPWVFGGASAAVAASGLLALRLRHGRR